MEPENPVRLGTSGRVLHGGSKHKSMVLVGLDCRDMGAVWEVGLLLLP